MLFRAIIFLIARILRQTHTHKHLHQVSQQRDVVSSVIGVQPFLDALRDV